MYEFALSTLENSSNNGYQSACKSGVVFVTIASPKITMRSPIYTSQEKNITMELPKAVF